MKLLLKKCILLFKKIIICIIPSPVIKKVKILYHAYFQCRPPLGRVRFGNLRRLTAVSTKYGIDRQESIARYYTEMFLGRHEDTIKGRVLEIGDNRYILQFGKEKVVQSDILHYTNDNPRATIVADLTKADHISSNIFDCIILTFTLQMIYDIRLAIKELYRILKPNGTLLVTTHGSCKKVGPVLGKDQWGEYWHFTGQSSQFLFEEAFKKGNVLVETFGNVLSSISFLHGLAVKDLKTKELDCHDPEYEVIIGIKALKVI